MKKLLFLIILLIYTQVVLANGISLRIIGGNKVDSVTKYPWITALLLKSVQDNYTAQFCGGTHIGNGWVLTSAHCFYVAESDSRKYFENDIDVLYGTISLDSGGTRVGVQKIYVHNNYNNIIHINDIALIKLKEPLPVEYANRVTNSELDYTSPGKKAYLIGWGDILYGDGTLFPQNLMEVEVPIVSKEDCIKVYGSYLIKSYNICDGYEEGGKDSCQGDSGGPLLVKDDEDNFLVAGLVSWANGCAEPNYYGVNTRVSQYEDWITHIIKNTPDTEFKTIMLPDNEMISLMLINGDYPNNKSSFNLESCKTNVQGTPKDMLKIFQTILPGENETEVSIIFPEISDSDEFYLEDNSKEYIFANNIIEIKGNKAVYQIQDNGNFDLDDNIGVIKTALLKTNRSYNELQKSNQSDCMFYSDENNHSSNSSGGGGCSAGNAGYMSWLIAMIIFLISRISKIKVLLYRK